MSKIKPIVMGLSVSALVVLIGFLSCFFRWSVENSGNVDFWKDVTTLEDDYVPPGKVFIDSEPLPASDQPEDHHTPSGAEDIPSQFRLLKDENPDTTAWIYYPGIFSMPVMQTSDNNYYLNYNEHRKKDKSGAAFLDTKCGGIVPCGLIHSHHQNKPDGFAKLKQLKDASFFKENRDFWIYDGTTFLRYRLFSVFVAGETSAASDLRVSFTSDADHERYVEWLSQKSMYRCGVHPLGDIIGLHTCDYSFKNAHLFVYAYRIK